MTHAGNRVREMVRVDPSLSLSSQSAFKVAYTFYLANRVLKTVLSIAMRTLDRLRKALGVIREMRYAELRGDEAARRFSRNHGQIILRSSAPSDQAHDLPLEAPCSSLRAGRRDAHTIRMLCAAYAIPRGPHKQILVDAAAEPDRSESTPPTQPLSS